MPYIKKTPEFEKLEQLSKKIPAPLSWLLPDPYSAASYLMPVGMPYYRVEVPAVRNMLGKAVGWGGPYRNWFRRNAHSMIAEIEDLLSELSQRTIQPESKLLDLPAETLQKGRFLFKKNVMTPEMVKRAKELTRKYPEELRFLKFPEKVSKYSYYEDPDQLFIELGKMLKYGKEVK